MQRAFQLSSSKWSDVSVARVASSASGFAWTLPFSFHYLSSFYQRNLTSIIWSLSHFKFSLILSFSLAAPRKRSNKTRLGFSFPARVTLMVEGEEIRGSENFQERSNVSLAFPSILSLDSFWPSLTLSSSLLNSLLLSNFRFHPCYSHAASHSLSLSFVLLHPRFPFPNPDFQPLPSQLPASESALT